MKHLARKYLSALALGVAFGAAAMLALPANPAGAQNARGSGAMPAGPDKPALAEDARQPIAISADERAFVLAEMRAFLESVQGVVDGVALGNMDDVAAAARKSGRAAMRKAPRTLMKKLPGGFRTLGLDTHVKFDELALEAGQIGGKAQLLKRLGALLSNCTSCHATYRFSGN